MRIIEIPRCTRCPHISHHGAWGDIAYVPYCRNTGHELPYEVNTSTLSGRPTATPTGIIPEWCPLKILPEPEPERPTGIHGRGGWRESED